MPSCSTEPRAESSKICRDASIQPLTSEYLLNNHRFDFVLARLSLHCIPRQPFLETLTSIAVPLSIRSKELPFRLSHMIPGHRPCKLSWIWLWAVLDTSAPDMSTGTACQMEVSNADVQTTCSDLELICDGISSRLVVLREKTSKSRCGIGELVVHSYGASLISGFKLENVVASAQTDCDIDPTSMFLSIPALKSPAALSLGSRSLRSESCGLDKSVCHKVVRISWYRYTYLHTVIPQPALASIRVMLMSASDRCDCIIIYNIIPDTQNDAVSL
jgi:hypothetical protein